ncbi:MAG TPA: four helix bundle protein [Candidatus Bacteroides intestinavium]|uniref:Four helix bundle protein n=1 Tax=Candidatus Bacteroides intestinavium TaxID=2838469 RepID=A0A9D2HQ63_9BACE|nr:four helix bundle protein [Candidatus Bacteroides intestinavium]
MTYNFKDILAWKKSHEFVLAIYKVTSGFPLHERFGLCSQFQRAAVSIPANIAEGYKKISNADKLRFLNIAQGSLEECRYYILLSKDLTYITENDYLNLNRRIDEVSYLLNAYCKGIIERKWND